MYHILQTVVQVNRKLIFSMSSASKGTASGIVVGSASDPLWIGSAGQWRRFARIVIGRQVRAS